MKIFFVANADRGEDEESTVRIWWLMPTVGHPFYAGGGYLALSVEWTIAWLRCVGKEYRAFIRAGFLDHERTRSHVWKLSTRNTRLLIEREAEHWKAQFAWISVSKGSHRSDGSLGVIWEQCKHPTKELPPQTDTASCISIAQIQLPSSHQEKCEKNLFSFCDTFAECQKILVGERLQPGSREERMSLLNSVCLLLKSLKSSEAQACLIYCVCRM